MLTKIAETLDGDVSVTSGDRGHVPEGGSTTSHHLAHRAADFSVSGYTLAEAYTKIKDERAKIFDKDKKFQLIHHGDHTATSGAHLHIGRYEGGTGLNACTEGLTAAGKDVYSCTLLTI